MSFGTLVFPFSVLILTLLKQAAAQHICDDITGSYRDWIGDAERKSVVVVGGGVAGLNATSILLEKGLTNVLLLEAQDYVGGRVKTYREGGILVEDGAEWINGGWRNFLYQLAEDLNGLTQPLPDRDYDWRIRRSDGTRGDPSGFDVAAAIYERCERDSVLANYQNTGYGQCYIDSFQKMYNAASSERDAWFHYLHMWVNKDTGTNTWTDQSGRDADHFTDWGLDEWNQWAEGYDTLVEYINSTIPNDIIRTSSPVCKIFWRGVPNNKVLLVTADGDAFLADQTIVTASIGHLKDRHRQLFSPRLPRSYRRNFNRIELGIADKVQIGWDQPWWGSSSPLVINVIFPVDNLSEEESWLYGVMEFMSIHQQIPILQAFVTGDSALQMELLPEETVKQHVVNHLSRLMGTQVPPPTFFRRSQWYLNPWMRGSYNSYITVKGDRQGLRNRSPLRRPLSNGKKVIFFAGEHTHTYRYGTVDGAMRTGTIAANALYKYRRNG